MLGNEVLAWSSNPINRFYSGSGAIKSDTRPKYVFEIIVKKCQTNVIKTLPPHTHTQTV